MVLFLKNTLLGLAGAQYSTGQLLPFSTLYNCRSQDSLSASYIYNRQSQPLGRSHFLPTYMHISANFLMRIPPSPKRPHHITINQPINPESPPLLSLCFLFYSHPTIPPNTAPSLCNLPTYVLRNHIPTLNILLHTTTQTLPPLFWTQGLDPGDGDTVLKSSFRLLWKLGIWRWLCWIVA